jgi:hypothetical protein
VRLEWHVTRHSKRSQFLNARRVLEVDQQGRESVGQSRYVRTTRAFDYYLTTLGKTFVYVDLVLPRTVIELGTSFDMIERLSSQIYAAGASSLARMEKLEMRIERAKLFARHIVDCANSHSMFNAPGLLDPLVPNFIRLLESDLARQSDLILESARSVFSSAGRQR